MKVNLVAASMSRLGGGVTSAVNSLALALIEKGFDIEMRAGFDACSELDRASWDPVAVTVYPVMGPSSFGWQRGLTADITAACPDILHLHGLWMYPSLALSRGSAAAARPRIISPHGMLDPWALANSGWKKRLVAALYEDHNLRGAACLHALNDAEYHSLRAYGLTGPIAVIPNGVTTEDADRQHPRPKWAAKLPDNAKVILFLGRIHPKKGLTNMIAALAEQDRLQRDPWHLVIAGWDQGNHSRTLQAQVDKAGLAEQVHFVGPQFGSEKSATLAFADAFVLPSQSEGLPMAVLEAWAFRLPVLMTDACNLPEGFAVGAAYHLSAEPTVMSSDIAEFFALGEDDLKKMGNNGRYLVERQFTWTQVAADMASVYRWCCWGGERPDVVRLL